MFNNSCSSKIYHQSLICLVVWWILHIIKANLYELPLKLQDFMQRWAIFISLGFQKSRSLAGNLPLQNIQEFLTWGMFLSKNVFMDNFMHVLLGEYIVQMQKQIAGDKLF